MKQYTKSTFSTEKESFPSNQQHTSLSISQSPSISVALIRLSKPIKRNRTKSRPARFSQQRIAVVHSSGNVTCTTARARRLGLMERDKSMGFCGAGRPWRNRALLNVFAPRERTTSSVCSRLSRLRRSYACISTDLSLSVCMCVQQCSALKGIAHLVLPRALCFAL